jgi:hypothetical protein
MAGASITGPWYALCQVDVLDRRDGTRRLAVALEHAHVDGMLRQRFEGDRADELGRRLGHDDLDVCARFLEKT